LIETLRLWKMALAFYEVDVPALFEAPQAEQFTEKKLTKPFFQEEELCLSRIPKSYL
jgi:hypothetical protein